MPPFIGLLGALTLQSRNPAMQQHAECMPLSCYIARIYKGVSSSSANADQGGHLGQGGDRVDEQSNAKRRKTTVTNVVSRGGENIFCADGQTKKSKIGRNALACVCAHTSATPTNSTVWWV